MYSLMNYLQQYFYPNNAVINATATSDLTITQLPNKVLRKINAFILDKKPFALSCKLLYKQFGPQGRTSSSIKLIDPNSLTILPGDVWSIIISKLPLKDELALASTCTAYNDIMGQLKIDEFNKSLELKVNFICEIITNPFLLNVFKLLTRSVNGICIENHKPLSRVIREIEECNNRLFSIFLKMKLDLFELNKEYLKDEPIDSITATNWTLLGFYMAKLSMEAKNWRRSARHMEYANHNIIKLLKDASIHLNSSSLSLLFQKVFIDYGLSDRVLQLFFQSLMNKNDIQLFVKFLESAGKLMMSPKFGEYGIPCFCLKGVCNYAIEMIDYKTITKPITYDLLRCSFILNHLNCILKDISSSKELNDKELNDMQRARILDCELKISKILSPEIKTGLMCQFIHEILLFTIYEKHESCHWFLNYSFSLIGKIEDKKRRMMIFNHEIKIFHDKRTIEWECVKNLSESLKNEWIERWNAYNVRYKGSVEFLMSKVYDYLWPDQKITKKS